MGIEALCGTTYAVDHTEDLLVNCSGATSPAVVAKISPRAIRKLVIVCDPERVVHHAAAGFAVGIPSSFGALEAACRQIAKDREGRADDPAAQKTSP